MASRLGYYSAVFLIAAISLGVPYKRAYGADAASSDYNAARIRVARVAPGLEALAGMRPPIIIITPELEKDACVLPNGNVVITTGLVESCETDDELAFIIAHELSHIMANDFKNSGAPALIGSKGIPVSELREIEADINAIHFIKKAGYNPYASIRVLTGLADEPGLRLRLETLSYYLKTLPHN